MLQPIAMALLPGAPGRSSDEGRENRKMVKRLQPHLAT
jgi:hypothetical protein